MQYSYYKQSSHTKHINYNFVFKILKMSSSNLRNPPNHPNGIKDFNNINPEDLKIINPNNDKVFLEYLTKNIANIKYIWYSNNTRIMRLYNTEETLDSTHIVHLDSILFESIIEKNIRLYIDCYTFEFLSENSGKYGKIWSNIGRNIFLVIAVYELINVPKYEFRSFGKTIKKNYVFDEKKFDSIKNNIMISTSYNQNIIINEEYIDKITIGELAEIWINGTNLWLFDLFKYNRKNINTIMDWLYSSIEFSNVTTPFHTIFSRLNKINNKLAELNINVVNFALEKNFRFMDYTNEPGEPFNVGEYKHHSKLVLMDNKSMYKILLFMVFPNLFFKQKESIGLFFKNIDYKILFKCVGYISNIEQIYKKEGINDKTIYDKYDVIKHLKQILLVAINIKRNELKDAENILLAQ